MSRVDEDLELPNEGEVPKTEERPSEEMQRCLDEVVTVLRKYELGVTLCLANDRESVLMYRIPEWCAVALNDGAPEVNLDKLWQTDDLEQLLSLIHICICPPPARCCSMRCWRDGSAIAPGINRCRARC